MPKTSWIRSTVLIEHRLATDRRTQAHGWHPGCIASRGKKWITHIHLPFLHVRRYASAGTSYGPVSVCRLCSIEMAERIGLGMGASFDLSYTVL